MLPLNLSRQAFSQVLSMTLLELSRKPATYRIVSYAAALLYLYLFSLLLFAPQSFLMDIGVAGNESAYFLARRASMLMLGFAILTFSGRNAPSSPARQAIMLAVALSMGGMAGLSFFEYFRGFANGGILPAGAVETILAGVYGLIWLANRKPAASMPRA